MRLIVTGFVLLVSVFLSTHSAAKIYKYQKDGVWYYTDSPPKEQVENSQQMADSGKTGPTPSAGGQVLLKDHVTRNAIETAAAATIAIKTPIGYGSGFFISTSGHIITNKHVIRTTETQARKANTYFDRLDKRVKNIEKGFKAEKKRLEDYEDELRRLQRKAGNERDARRKKSIEKKYERRKKEFDRRKARYEERRKKFRSQRDRYKSGRGEYNYRSSVANLTRSFTITLVDDTQLYARLMATSKNHDLALLKLDGYTTPALTPAQPYSLAQGNPVYAIGNPANLRNTVTSGIFSGFEGDFIQTNAQINPGNSGGPLIDAEGRVLGINTKKKVGATLEGLGFAIPIQTALSEFRAHLQ